VFLKQILHDLRSAHVPRKLLCPGTAITQIDHQVTEQGFIATHFQTFFLKNALQVVIAPARVLSQHLAYLTLLADLLLNTLGMLRVQLGYRCILPSRITNATFYNIRIELPAGIIQLEVAIKLPFKYAADAIHDTVVHTYGHPAQIMPYEGLLFLRSVLFGDGQKIGGFNTELTQALRPCILDICIVLTHERRIDVSHEIRFLVCHNPRIQITSCDICLGMVFVQRVCMPVIPITRHGLTNDAFGFISFIPSVSRYLLGE